MLLKLDTHNKQVNDTVNTLKNCYNDVYANNAHRVDSLVMRQLKIDWFEINALKLQAVFHNTTCLIIPALLFVFPYNWPTIFVTHLAS